MITTLGELNDIFGSQDSAIEAKIENGCVVCYDSGFHEMHEPGHDPSSWPRLVGSFPIHSHEYGLAHALSYAFSAFGVSSVFLEEALKELIALDPDKRGLALLSLAQLQQWLQPEYIKSAFGLKEENGTWSIDPDWTPLPDPLKVKA